MASNSEKNGEAASSDYPTATVAVGKESEETREVVGDDPKSERIKPTRYPRWTRQETLLLIEAKKRVENRDYLGNLTPQSILLNQGDPKWLLVSSYIQQHGVKRAPIQCRKRWGNLLTDFRKVKKYESEIKGDEGESFWLLRSDKRKQNKLPGFFDEVVYRVLDAEASSVPWALINMSPKPNNSANYHVGKLKLLGQSIDDDDDDDDDETFLDTFEANNEEKMGFNATKASSSKETLLRRNLKVKPIFTIAAPGNCQKEAESEEGYKRRRLTAENGEDNTNFSNDVTKVLRRNTKTMKKYLETQNMNHQLAMEHQKELSDKFVAAIGKITDAITKIAEKL